MLSAPFFQLSRSERTYAWSVLLVRLRGWRPGKIRRGARKEKLSRASRRTECERGPRWTSAIRWSNWPISLPVDLSDIRSTKEGLDSEGGKGVPGDTIRRRHMNGTDLHRATEAQTDDVV